MPSRRTAASLFVCLLLIAGCSRGSSAPQTSAAPQSAPAPQPAANPDDSGRPKIVVLGDSLTAGLGLLELQAYPALLQQKLDAEGYHWEVVNAGISGDTSAAGLQRLDWALGQGDVRILILELGANDGLRGLPVAEMKKNLAAIIEHAQEKRIAVLLAGMEAPPNFGPEYTVSFRQVYRELAKQYKEVAGKASALGLVDQRDASLDSYVTRKALDGLFLTMAHEEAAIRENPAGQASSLLRKVFGTQR
jgi:acyl-CoA thioesterase-1